MARASAAKLAARPAGEAGTCRSDQQAAGRSGLCHRPLGGGRGPAGQPAGQHHNRHLLSCRQAGGRKPGSTSPAPRPPAHTGLTTMTLGECAAQRSTSNRYRQILRARPGRRVEPQVQPAGDHYPPELCCR